MNGPASACDLPPPINTWWPSGKGVFAAGAEPFETLARLDPSALPKLSVATCCTLILPPRITAAVKPPARPATVLRATEAAYCPRPPNAPEEFKAPPTALPTPAPAALAATALQLKLL